jgi:hypothetical protein
MMRLHVGQTETVQTAHAVNEFVETPRAKLFFEQILTNLLTYLLDIKRMRLNIFV